jgi:hypothetical protein
MNVKELIEKLQQFPQDQYVMLRDNRLEAEEMNSGFLDFEVSQLYNLNENGDIDYNDPVVGIVYKSEE